MLAAVNHSVGAVWEVRRAGRAASYPWAMETLEELVFAVRVITLVASVVGLLGFTWQLRDLPPTTPAQRARFAALIAWLAAAVYGLLEQILQDAPIGVRSVTTLTAAIVSLWALHRTAVEAEQRRGAQQRDGRF